MLDAFRHVLDDAFGPLLGLTVLLVISGIGGLVVMIDLAVQTYREYRGQR